MTENPSASARSETSPAYSSDGWREIAGGAAIGGVFALSAAVLVGGIMFYPVTVGLAGAGNRVVATGAAGCLASLVAMASLFFPRVRDIVAVGMAALLFAGAACFALMVVTRDLGLNSYSKRTHASLKLEEIASTSPSAPERTNYRLYYALELRIPAAELVVEESFPLSAWHLRYRGNVASVSNAGNADLPRAPAPAEISTWLASGGLDLPTLDGKRLVIPPQIAARRNLSGGRFAIVSTGDGNTYVLLPLDTAERK